MLTVADRLIPKNSEVIEVPNGVVYIYERDNRFLARGYQGRKVRPSLFVSSKDKQVLLNSVNRFLAEVEKITARKEAKKNHVHSFKLGDILVSTWGYDQTNVDFYQVVGVGAKSIKIQELNQRNAGNEGFMSVDVLPVKDSFFSDKIETKIVQSYPSGDTVREYISISSYATASKWSGESVNKSWGR